MKYSKLSIVEILPSDIKTVRLNNESAVSLWRDIMSGKDKSWNIALSLYWFKKGNISWITNDEVEAERMKNDDQYDFHFFYL